MKRFMLPLTSFWDLRNISPSMHLCLRADDTWSDKRTASCRTILGDDAGGEGPGEWLMRGHSWRARSGSATPCWRYIGDT
jgi:hypothetical protein